MRSKEEKLAVVGSVLPGTSVHGCESKDAADHHTVMNWEKKYLAESEAVLGQKKKPSNPLLRYERRKKLAYKE